MANIVWGIGVEPEYLTDRTQMCFYIIPRQGGSEDPIAGGHTQVPRQPKGRRGKLKRLKEGSNEN
ncbi:hypothetical protein EB118_08205 [bacterium]|nr:hypothetical protein [bacterium]